MEEKEITSVSQQEKYFVYMYSFPDGKKYIGTSQKTSARFGYKSTYKHQKELFEAMNGEYTKTILCYCLTREDAYNSEIKYIKFYDSVNNGYNKELGGNKGKDCSKVKPYKRFQPVKKGSHRSQEVKDKISITKRRLAV